MNHFSKLNDAALKDALVDYMAFGNSNLIQDGYLSDKKEKYVNDFGDKAFAIMEKDLLFECAKRWMTYRFK